MSAQIKDGGPAFPHHDGSFGAGMDSGSHGMTLRDYFATHATQPGVTEIVDAAGLHCPDGFTVWVDADTRIGKFTDWWGSLTNKERFDLSSKVKFQEADAMLRAREVQS